MKFFGRSSLYHKREMRLTREAMKSYLQKRGDMVIVMLHAKVNIEPFFSQTDLAKAFSRR